MRVEQLFGSNRFVVVRGQDERRQFFCFFVDSDSACWSKRQDAAASYAAKELAENAIVPIKARAKSKRGKP